MCLVNRTGNPNSQGTLSCIVQSKSFLQSAKHSYLPGLIETGKDFSPAYYVPFSEDSPHYVSQSLHYFSFKAKIIKNLDFLQQSNSPVNLMCTKWISYKHTIFHNPKGLM